MPVNILVIDDDKVIVDRLMKNLKRADTKNFIDKIIVDDRIIKLDSIENYDTTIFDTKFDIALIDYQLTRSFTGILVSAWISLYLNIPRLSLTTASYPGNPEFFNGSILKNEITDSPNIIIDRIDKCISDFNSELWLNTQHKSLVAQYQKLLEYNTNDSIEKLNLIQNILDQFEKVIDAHQESEIKKALLFEETTNYFKEKQQENDRELNELTAKLAKYLQRTDYE